VPFCQILIVLSSPFSLFLLVYVNIFHYPRPGSGTSLPEFPWGLVPIPAADDRSGFPKPGRCIKQIATVFFRVGVT